MSDHILAWTAFAVLLVLCLPFVGVRKLILEAYCWTLRMALLLLLAGGALLWFRPDLLPAQAGNVLYSIYGVRDILPSPGSPTFGLAAAALVAAVFLPILAMLDVTRRLAARPLVLLQTEPIAATAERPVAEARHALPPVAAPRRHDRRAAAETMAEVGSRKPFRVADEVR